MYFFSKKFLLSLIINSMELSNHLELGNREEEWRIS